MCFSKIRYAYGCLSMLLRTASPKLDTLSGDDFRRLLASRNAYGCFIFAKGPSRESQRVQYKTDPALCFSKSSPKLNTLSGDDFRRLFASRNACSCFFSSPKRYLVSARLVSKTRPAFPFSKFSKRSKRRPTGRI